MNHLNYVLMFMYLLAAGQLCGQSLERYVIGNAGQVTENAGQQLSFTVGDAVVGIHQTADLQIYQGFQQGFLATITGVDGPGGRPDLIAYPNPVRGTLFIEATSQDAYQLSWEIFDLNGRHVFGAPPREGSGRIRKQIDVGTLTPGMYFLVFRSSGGLPVKTIKLQKIPVGL